MVFVAKLKIQIQVSQLIKPCEALHGHYFQCTYAFSTHDAILHHVLRYRRSESNEASNDESECTHCEDLMIWFCTKVSLWQLDQRDGVEFRKVLQLRAQLAEGMKQAEKRGKWMVWFGSPHKCTQTRGTNSLTYNSLPSTGQHHSFYSERRLSTDTHVPNIYA